MNLLHELKPYDSELDVWKHRQKIPHNLQPIKLIYQKLWEEIPKIRTREIKLNCGSCVNDMLKALYNCREELRKTTYFKGDKPKITKITPTDVIEIEENTPDQDYNSMSLDELKDLCRERGVKFHHLNKEPKLIELLKENDG